MQVEAYVTVVWTALTESCVTDSLKPEDYPRLPLFTTDRTAPEKCVFLNQVFWLVLDDAFSWRSMSRLACNTVEEVEHLAESQCVSIAASKSGAALKAVPKISKHLVAYMAGLVAVSPYKHGAFDPRAKGIAEQAATEAFNNLNKLKNEPYMAYLKRKLGEWYSEAPQPERQQPVADDDEDEPAHGDDLAAEPEDGDGAGAGDGSVFLLD